MPKFLCVKTFKKLTALTLSVALLLNPIAFATSSYIEVDSQESETADRLHTMMPLSNVQDISHIEIDSDEQRIRVYRDTETTEDNSDPETSARESVLDLSRDNVYNLPWHLGQEGLVCFLSQHTAWLTPLGDDDYRLEFTGRLLGGMWWGDSSDDSGDYSNDYGSGSYEGGSNDRCVIRFTTYADSSQPTYNDRSSDYGRSYGKNSDGGSSSSDYGCTNSSSTNNQSRPTTSKPAAPRPTVDLSKLYAQLNIKPPAKPAAPVAKPAVLKLPAQLTAKPVAKPAAPAAKPAAPVAKPTVPNILAQLNIKPAAKPVAKPAIKTDLSKLLAAAKPPAKPAATAAKPVPKVDLSKLLTVAKPAAKPAPKPIVIHPLIQQVKYRVNNQDPMSPHDFFDLEGKMGGAAMGGGKPNWNRALGVNNPKAQKIERDLGTVSESGFLKAAERFLGKDYVVHPKGRYVSKDGSRQVRYGKHETKNSKDHHAHFESYDMESGKVYDSGRVVIKND